MSARRRNPLEVRSLWRFAAPTPGWFAACLATLVGLFHIAALSGRGAFFVRDLGLFGYPLAWYHRASFWRGEWPLWNPLNDCGVPFLAQWNTAVLYPGSLVYLLLPLPWSLSLYLLLHVVLAGVGMFCLAWRWTGGRWAATFAGIAFAFGGLTQNSLMWPNNLAALAWMPWVVASAEQAGRHGGRWIGLAAIVGTLQMLSGAPEVILSTWIAAGLLVAGQRLPHLLSRWRALGRVAVLAGLVAALAAVQLLPFLELLAESQRSAEFSDTHWAVTWAGLGNWWLPLFRCFRTPQGVVLQDFQAWTSSFYVGVVTLVLAAWAAWRIRQPRVWCLAGFAVLGVALSLGPEGGLYTWVSSVVPAVKIMRFPVKFVVWPVFALPLVAAYAFRELADSPRPPAGSRAPLSLLALGSAVIVGFFTWLGSRPGPAQDLTTWTDLWPNGLLRLLFLGAAVAALGFASKGLAPWRGPLVVLLLLADLMTHVPWQNPTAHPSLLLPRPLAEQTPPPPGTERMGGRAMLSAPVYQGLSRLVLPDREELLRLYRRALAENLNLIEGQAKIDGMFSLDLDDYHRLFEKLMGTDSPPAPLLDFLGVDYWVRRRGSDLVWTRRRSAHPLILAGQAPVFSGPSETEARLLSRDYSPATEVLLPETTRAKVAARSDPSATVRPFSWGTHAITFEVSAQWPTMVTIAQAYHPSWRATVDGETADLLRANGAFQALAVPAGTHPVRLAFVDRTFQAAAALSLAATAGVLTWTGRRKRRPDPTPYP